MAFPARCATFIFLAVILPHTANAQTFVSIFDGSTLNGWQAEHRTAAAKDGVLTLTSGPGWVRTQRVYANFVLRLDVRVEEKAVANIYVRAWPTFDSDRRPSNGALIRLTGQKAVAGSDGWQRLEVEAVGSTLTVRADGQVVYSNPNVGNPQGHIALAVNDDRAQFRNIQIETRRPPSPPPASTTARVIGKGVSAPRVIEDPKPRYTADAMRARITGRVIMNCVVGPDGKITDVQLVQSLDPHFGLDREALNAASKWRFEPGRLEDGQPVAVRVVIELEFNLK
jgi:TonB family protein